MSVVSMSVVCQWQEPITTTRAFSTKRRRDTLPEHRHTSEEWEQRKQRITQLFEDHELEDVAAIMGQEGFEASIPQYRNRLKNWGHWKYLKLTEKQWLYIGQKLMSREREEKKTAFKLNGKKIPSSKLEKELIQKLEHDNFDVSSLRSAMSSCGDVSVYTTSTANGVTMGDTTRERRVVNLRGQEQVQVSETHTQCSTCNTCGSYHNKLQIAEWNLRNIEDSLQTASIQVERQQTIMTKQEVEIKILTARLNELERQAQPQSTVPAIQDAAYYNQSSRVNGTPENDLQLYSEFNQRVDQYPAVAPHNIAEGSPVTDTISADTDMTEVMLEIEKTIKQWQPGNFPRGKRVSWAADVTDVPAQPSSYENVPSPPINDIPNHTNFREFNDQSTLYTAKQRRTGPDYFARSMEAIEALDEFGIGLEQVPRSYQRQARPKSLSRLFREIIADSTLDNPINSQSVPSPTTLKRRLKGSGRTNRASDSHLVVGDHSTPDLNLGDSDTTLVNSSDSVESLASSDGHKHKRHCSAVFDSLEREPEGGSASDSETLSVSDILEARLWSQSEQHRVQY